MRCYVVLVLLVLISGCAQTPVAEPPDQPQLVGPTWRLVVIQSMDDSEYRPGDKESYQLTFVADGTVQVKVDCNRGFGTWMSQSASQLQIESVATTRAFCPPPSLHDRFLMDLQYVRSYVFSQGHLFLATMADGAILEFEPL